ncbi:MAG: hypothetical protein AB1486_27055 [Planctomycetota bacterium]
MAPLRVILVVTTFVLTEASAVAPRQGSSQDPHPPSSHEVAMTRVPLAPRPEGQDQGLPWSLIQGQSVFEQEVHPRPGSPTPFSERGIKEPGRYRCPWPFRGMAECGGEPIAFVLDSTDLAQQGFDLLVIDANRNGDLTDDPVIEALPLAPEARSASLYSLGPESATGEPDGDTNPHGSWKSRTPEGQREWLVLEYGEPVLVTSVRIVESSCPGGVTRLSRPAPDRSEIELWRGEDPLPPMSEPGNSEIHLASPALVDRLKIDIDSPNVGGFQAIDAVGLVEASGETHWAIAAEASSSLEQKISSVFIDRRFPRIPSKILVDGVATESPIDFSVSLYLMEGAWRQVDVRFYPTTCREGFVELEGKRHRLVLLDQDGDGCFNGKARIGEREFRRPVTRFVRSGDILLVDPDFDKERPLYRSVTGIEEAHFVSEILRIGERCYRLEMPASGASLTFTPWDGPIGRVSNPIEGSIVLLAGAHGVVKLGPTPPEGTPLPAGSWELVEYWIDRTPGGPRTGERGEPQGTFVRAAGSQGVRELVIRAGEMTELPFGPPFRPTVEVFLGGGDAKPPGVAWLDLVLRGRGGEPCIALRVEGHSPEGPGFVITTSAGEVVERGAFKFG